MEELDSFSFLRKSFDSKESIVSGGHRVMKTAGATRHAERMKRVPVWATDDEKIRQLVRRCFPSPNQRKSAVRMVSIIYRYYRVGETAGKIAEDLGMSIRAVEESLRRINKTANRPIKPRGRRPNAVGIQKSNGHSGGIEL